MALDLDLSYSQSNDATTLTVTDTAGEYDAANNTDGWGSPNADYADIVASTDTASYVPDKYHLTLTITVTDKNGTSTAYDAINLYDHNGAAFTAATDLTWDITAADLVASGTAMGTSSDRLDDGTYAIVYKLANNDDGTTVDTVTESILVDGDVRYDVYNKLRQIPVNYDNEEKDMTRDIMEALLAYSYLQGIEASAAVAMTEEISSQLYTLDKLLSDGSNYTW